MNYIKLERNEKQDLLEFIKANSSGRIVTEVRRVGIVGDNLLADCEVMKINLSNPTDETALLSCIVDRKEYERWVQEGKVQEGKVCPVSWENNEYE